MNISEIIEKAYNNAINKGFFDRDVEINDMLIQIVSEIGELYEVVRRGEGVDRISEEMADIIISWASMAGRLQAEFDMDMEYEVMRKMTLDEGRPYRNGKLF